jgi:hypothetical protein
MNNTSTTTNFVPDTEYSGITEDVFTLNDPVSFSVMGKVAPASTKVPTGEILLDGSISFKLLEQSNNNIKLDRFGRVVEIVLTTGEKTTLGYNKQGELSWLKQNDGEILTKNDDGWFNGQAYCWTDVVALLDGTIWCKKANDVIVHKNIDGTSTWHDLKQKFILWLDTQKRIVGIRYPNGQSRSFAYNTKGFCMVTEPDSSKFILKDEAWQSDRDSTLQILDLSLSNDGTLTYRVGNQLMSTTASGKLKRTMLPESEITPAPAPAISLQNNDSPTEVQPFVVQPSMVLALA